MYIHRRKCCLIQSVKLFEATFVACLVYIKIKALLFINYSLTSPFSGCLWILQWGIFPCAGRAIVLSYDWTDCTFIQ